MIRRLILSLAAVLFTGSALAHHGWSWTTGETVELTGTVTEARLGNPHGDLTLEADGTAWTVEVGQPWRNERAGLSNAMMQPGADLTAVGERSADEGERLMKAERIVIDGQNYDLYPERL